MRFRRELKEGKSKLTFWAEINGGYEKLKRNKKIKKTRSFLEYKRPINLQRKKILQVCGIEVGGVFLEGRREKERGCGNLEWENGV